MLCCGKILPVLMPMLEIGMAETADSPRLRMAGMETAVVNESILILQRHRRFYAKTEDFVLEQVMKIAVVY